MYDVYAINRHVVPTENLIILLMYNIHLTCFVSGNIDGHLNRRLGSGVPTHFLFHPRFIKHASIRNWSWPDYIYMMCFMRIIIICMNQLSVCSNHMHQQ